MLALLSYILQEANVTTLYAGNETGADCLRSAIKKWQSCFLYVGLHPPNQMLALFSSAFNCPYFLFGFVLMCDRFHMGAKVMWKCGTLAMASVISLCSTQICLQWMGMRMININTLNIKK